MMQRMIDFDDPPTFPTSRGSWADSFESMIRDRAMLYGITEGWKIEHQLQDLHISETSIVKVRVPVEKRGLFDIKKTVMETCTIEVDGKTCKKCRKKPRVALIQTDDSGFWQGICSRKPKKHALDLPDFFKWLRTA